MEPRFGFDLSQLRLHTDKRAADSAASVDAHAYTVGRHLVFGAGQYAPATAQGRSLIAHELAHAVQQGQSNEAAPTRISNPDEASEREAESVADHVIRMAPSSGFISRALGSNSRGTPPLARACMSKEACEKKKEKTPEELMQEETSKPENKAKREKREKACGATPPDPGCTADGHGRRAVQAEKLLHDWDPQRLKFIKKIVVDMDMESGFGALTGPCSNFTPPIPGGGICTLVPEWLEKQSEQFNTTMDPAIDGKPRDIWRDNTLAMLVHETEHARFNVTTIRQPRAGACQFDDIQTALTEIAAMLVEFPIWFRSVRENVSLKPQERVDRLNFWFTRRITGERQSFKSTLQTIYCKCECADADVYVKKTIEFSTADWTVEEKERFHSELNDPKWAEHQLRWPVKPPSQQGTPGSQQGATAAPNKPTP
jgi:hypothetical protein